tara:strand:- start:6386 stop:7924 length:1539 start_codon:yes stop_codon:yes gene_type:complete
MANYWQGLNNLPNQHYYQGNDHGNYQFISLKELINQFIITYVGEGKIISKVKRTDVMFHAQRALAELSFDTFKSCKAQEIIVPNSLQMILPHDYIDYTKVSWVDDAGIKHVLYPTNLTSNPFSINQNADGNYLYEISNPLVRNKQFSVSGGTVQPPWITNGPQQNKVEITAGNAGNIDLITVASDLGDGNNRLRFRFYSNEGYGEFTSHIYTVWQKIDVSNQNYVNLSGEGKTNGAGGKELGSTVWLGLTADEPSSGTIFQDSSTITSTNKDPNWLQTISGDDAYLEWTKDVDTTENIKELKEEDVIDVSAYDEVYVVITSWAEYSDFIANGATSAIFSYMDNVNVTGVMLDGGIQTNNTLTSTAWENYKSQTPSENTSNDYEDETYWPYHGERYGLEPSHAQVNGSFYVDCRRGKINFSSNLSGKTVILDYISDHLGTDAEMQVHKFAEEAMYKWIAHAILSTRMNTPEQLVQRFKKERFAETRKAKLRLSNINLEEITQILRGKSKQIKH